jgi:cobalt-zinc-cadmium efflux system outer membrane protein
MFKKHTIAVYVNNFVRAISIKGNISIGVYCSLFLISESILADSTINLSMAVQKALAKNPELQVFSYREDALIAQRKVAGMRPGLELGAGAENFSGEDDLEGFDGAEVTVSLSSVLELGSKRKIRKEIISEAQTVLEAEKQIASLALVGEVTRRFVAILASQEFVKLAEETLGLSKQTLLAVQKRANAAAVSEAELKRAQAAVVRSELNLSEEIRRFEFSKMALSSLWAEVSVQFSTVEGDLFSFGEDISFEELYGKVSSNPAVAVLAAQTRLKETELRLAKADSKTDINWSLGVKEFQENNTSAFTAGLSIPLFNTRRNKGFIASANAELAESQINNEVVLLKLHTQLFDAYHNRQQAILTTTQLQERIIPALENALTSTKQAYERGRYSYTEYVTANQELLEARRSLIESSVLALNYGTEIEQITSESLSTK